MGGGEGDASRGGGLSPALERFLGRSAWLGWLWRWGLSIGSLALGLLILFVLRRGVPHVAWLVGYLLFLWLLVTVVAEWRALLEERGGGLALGAAEYTIQSLVHGLLLLVLPAYYASTTLTSVNVLFLLAVALGALLTAVDPWYRALVPRRPWRGHLLLGFAMFAALNVALPLVGVRPFAALLASAPLALLALAPALRRGSSWRRASLEALALAILAVGALWYARAAVPPAPLSLKRAVIARDVVALEPVDEAGRSIPAARLAEWGGLTAYTAIYAPAGLRQGVVHVWRRDGQVVARVALSPIKGGRAEGFRTFSRRRDFKAPVAGQYTVDVMTVSGQLIGRLRFTVTP